MGAWVCNCGCVNGSGYGTCRDCGYKSFDDDCPYCGTNPVKGEYCSLRCLYEHQGIEVTMWGYFRNTVTT